MERSAANVTVADIVERAGVSRRTFYELFTSSEDCLLAALDHALAAAFEHLNEAAEPSMRWRERIRAGLLALLRFLDAEPFMGRLLIVESLGAGHAALERRARSLAGLAAVVAEGQEQARAGSEPSPLTAEGIVGAVLSVIHARMVAGDRRALVELEKPLMSMIVLPYLGLAESRRELARPAAVAERGGGPAQRRPLKKLEMRLTYRTMRVLLAIAEHPGSSNRVVGRFAGTRDQGQISKLLARLERLGLIENAGDGHLRGAANAWRLSERGWEVQAALGIRGPCTMAASEAMLSR